MTGRLSPTQPDRSFAPRLALALIAGPTAWMARLLISLSLIPYACQAASEWILHLISVLFGLAAAAALVISNRCRKQASGHRGSDGPGRDRNRFIALLAVAVNAASLLAIVLESLAMVFVDSCLR